DYKPYLEPRWHDEFDAWAATYSDSWAGIDTESAAAADLYKADLAFLQTVAERVGPTVDEIAESLRPDEMPADPNFGTLVEAYAGLSDMVGAKRPS
ncbi:MAG TPA: hypothetical protein VN636_02800, partial [Acidimicrobiia bacterium]|nr:hypothetical protein [Acidimicrobiia bacterium]